MILLFVTGKHKTNYVQKDAQKETFQKRILRTAIDFKMKTVKLLNF